MARNCSETQRLVTYYKRHCELLRAHFEKSGQENDEENKGLKRIKRRFKQIFAGNDSCTTHRLNEGNM